MNTETIFKQRIGYKNGIKDISQAICKKLGLGELVEDKLILTGYEDFNLILHTTKDRYFVKIFANFRDDANCRRYVDILAKASEAGVKIPKLFRFNQEYLHKMEVNGVNLRMAVMEFIEGETFFSLRTPLIEREIRLVTHQASLINSIDMHPASFYDSWAIVNFPTEFEKKGKYLTPKDLESIQPLLKEFQSLNIKRLPHCFVHGDILTTNVMKGNDQQLWILDFSVSNYYPRIQELAVLACNLFFNEKSRAESENNLRIMLNEYQKTITLTAKELDSLPTYIKLAHAMHLLCANYEKVVNKNNLQENEYWLEQGRAGLNQI
jgi:Ser/Thr protein kinase RdoA (MazF antagonist)